MNCGQIPHDRSVLDWAVSSRSKGAAPHCGDGFILQRDKGAIMAAVVDGTGSGAPAHQAADTCIKALGDAGLRTINQSFDIAHTALQGTRGVAMGIALIDMDRGQVTWAAVGEVDGVIFRGEPGARRDSIVQRGGTLGQQFTGIHWQMHDIHPGDLLMLTSDGVSGRHRDAISAGSSAEQAAHLCMSRFGRADDDAIVLALKLRAQ